jgi:hypothetical protein
MLARAIDRMQAPRAGAIRRMALIVMASLPIVFTLRFVALSGSLGRGIVPPARASVDPLASWLDAHVRPTGTPRVLTTFFYGSYLTWRLPAYSMSIDGRTFFPDSAAEPDAFRVADNGPFPYGPWQSADVAIVPMRFPVASVLDTAAGWMRADTVPKGVNVQMAAGLWVRRSWLAHARR